MKIQEAFYDSSAGAWKFSENPVVLFLYKYGTLPGLLLAAVSMAVAGASFFTKKFESLKKPAVIVIITIMFGPGLFINVILKNYTGRPRPREVKEFAGKWKYRDAFQFGAPGRGHSFPAGHPSMGFLFGALYFAYRRRNKKAAYTALAIGLAYGTAMGAGRMAQGAHFFSDVLWSGVITFITARAAQVFLIDSKVFRQGWLRAGRENRPAAILVSSVFIILLVFFFLFSVPFHKEKKYNFSVDTPGYRLRVNSKAGDIMVREAGKGGPRLEIEARGFGFPGRDYSEDFEVKRKNRMTDIELYTSTTGFFSEISADIKLSLPPGKKVFIMINNSEGDVDFRLPSKYGEAVIYTGRGRIMFSPGKAALSDVYLKNNGGIIVFDMDSGLEISAGSRIMISSEGKVVLRNNSSYFRHINTDADKINGSKELYYRPKSKNGVALDIISKKIIIKEE